MKEKPEGKIFEIQSTDVERGSFWVVILPADVENGSNIKADDLIPIYCGDGSMAGDLFMAPIAIDLQRKGANVGLCFHPDDEMGDITSNDDDS